MHPPGLVLHGALPSNFEANSLARCLPIDCEVTGSRGLNLGHVAGLWCSMLSTTLQSGPPQRTPVALLLTDFAFVGLPRLPDLD